MSHQEEIRALLDQCRDPFTRVVDSRALVPGLASLNASRATGIRLEGEALTGNGAWANLVCDFPLHFAECTFLDGMDLSGAKLLELSLDDVVSKHGISLRSIDVSLDVAIRSVSAPYIDATRAEVGGSLLASDLDLEGAEDFPGREVRTSLSLNMAQIRSVALARLKCGGCCNFFRGRFGDLLIKESAIAFNAGLSHDTQRFVNLNRSTPLTHSALWLSQIEVLADVTLGPDVEVTGDVRLVGASVGKALRIGVDTDWGRRQGAGYRANAGALKLVGGYLNLLRCKVGERTEISAVLTGPSDYACADAGARSSEPASLGPDVLPAALAERSPVVILNEAELGDLVLHGMSLTSGSGLTSLDGASYSNIEVSWLNSSAPEVTACGAPRGRRFSAALFPLPIIRSYEAARSEERESALGGKRQGRRSLEVDSLDASLVFRSSNYRQLARILMAQGREQAAQTVLIAMHRDQRQWESRGMGRVWNGVRDGVSLYGFALSRVFWALVLVVTVAVGVVALGKAAGDFLATQPSMVQQDDQVVGSSNSGAVGADPTDAAQCTDSYPCLNPVVYTIDQLIPVLTLGQVEYWQPRGDWWGRWVLVLLTGLAWLGTTVLIAGLGSLTRELSDSEDIRA